MPQCRQGIQGIQARNPTHSAIGNTTNTSWRWSDSWHHKRFAMRQVHTKPDTLWGSSLQADRAMSAALPSACMQDLHLSAAITHRLFIQCFIAFRLSPICSKTVLSNICPSTGSSSIFQSPVCTMLPCSLRRMRPQQSGMEWVTLRGEHLQQSGYSQATPKWAAPGIAGYVVREACHFSLDGKGMLFQDLAW